MTDYIKHKEYKLPNGRTVTADFNELGLATITIQAMDALFDILNSSWEKSNRKRQQKTIDVVEVVRCKDCKHKEREQPGMVYCPMMVGSWVADDHFCKWGERGE